MSLVRKQHGNHLETPGYHHVSSWFPLGKLEDSMWLPLKENILRSGFRDSLAWNSGGNYMETPGFQKGNMRETTRKPGFPTWKPGETTWKPRVSQGKHKGNPIETSSFPKVNIRETTWKPHISIRFR